MSNKSSTKSKMRSVKEVKAIMNDVELEEIVNYLPEGMTTKEALFIVAATEDDLDADGWRNLFAACQGKTEEEIVKIAYEATAE